MLAPGPEQHPDHRVVTEAIPARVEIFMDGEKIAESKRAIRLKESGLSDKIYLPREDIRGLEFHKFDDYHCPFKGHGDLFHVKHGSHIFQNAAWTYHHPYDDVMEIKNLVAFDPTKVEQIRITG